MSGVCLTTAQCAGGLNPPLDGFYTDGDCPDGIAIRIPAIFPSRKSSTDENMIDPSNIKCCFIAGCSVTDGALGYGWCKNTGEGCGGRFVAGRCPGPADVKCC